MEIRTKLISACDHLLKPWSKTYSCKEKTISWIATLTFGILSAGLVQGGSLILKCLLKKKPKIHTGTGTSASKSLTKKSYVPSKLSDKLWAANYRIQFYQKKVAEWEEKIAKVEEQLDAKYIIIRDPADPLVEELKKLVKEKAHWEGNLAASEADVKIYESYKKPVKAASTLVSKS